MKMSEKGGEVKLLGTASYLRPPRYVIDIGLLRTLLCRYFSSHLPCCAIIFLRTYPAGCLFFFSLTLLCPHFIFTYPAEVLIFFALTLLCPNFSFTYPAVPLFFFALTLLCPNFTFTYPVPGFPVQTLFDFLIAAKPRALHTLVS